MRFGHGNVGIDRRGHVLHALAVVAHDARQARRGNFALRRRCHSAVVTV